MCKAGVEGRRVRGGFFLSAWVQSKKVCNYKSVELNNAKVKCLHREQWSDFVNGVDGAMIIFYDPACF